MGRIVVGTLILKALLVKVFSRIADSFLASESCEKAPPTTKTVQKIKKMAFLPNISVLLYVIYEKFSQRDELAPIF